MILKGREIVLTEDDDSVIAACKSCDLEIECEAIETSSPTNGKFRTFMAGQKTWHATMSYLVVALKSMVDLTGVELTLKVKNTTSDTDYLVGKAICTKCKITATTGSLVQGSFVFQGSGELK